MASPKTTDASIASPVYRGLEALGLTLRRDPIARTASLVFVAGLIFFAVPLADLELRQAMTEHVSPLLFLSLTLVALLFSLRQVESSDERRFWIDLAVAYGCWLASRLLHLLLPLTTPRAVAEDILYGLFYLAMVMALERRVHRRSEWRPTRLERALSWPGVVVFVLGILIYFVFIPLRQAPEIYLGGVPSSHYYVSMDIYLTLTVVYLSRTSHGKRWKALYSMMTVAVACTLASDLSEAMGLFRGWVLGGPYDGLWNLPLLAMILTARMRHVRFAARQQSHYDKMVQEGNLSGPNGRTMVMALAFPLVHFAGYSTGTWDPEVRTQREVLILVWLLLLGTIAFIQHRVLSRRFHSMVQDRKNFEESLRNSKKDLRFMIERHHTSEQLRLSELKFFKAFRASPDVMVISSVEDGRLIEVNDSFERILGYRREEAVGRTAAELGLWEEPQARQRMTLALQDQGNVQDLEFRFKRRDGDVGVALFSAELITIDDEPCLLSVAHDITTKRHIESRLRTETDYLQNLDAAAVVTALDHRILFWNARAEDLYGWLEAEVLDRSVFEVIADSSDRAWDQVAKDVRQRGVWEGKLEAQHRDGSPLEVETWWSRIRDEGNRLRPQRLLISRDLSAPVNGSGSPPESSLGVDQLASEGHEGQGQELDVLGGEGDADDGDGQDAGVDQVADGDAPAEEDDPHHVEQDA